MLCQNCKKKEACYHSTLIVNGNSQSTHLCADCAKKEGVNNNQTKFFEEFFKDFDNIFNANFNKINEFFCPSCNINFNDFRLNRFLGCPDCFDVFKSDLERLIEDDDKIEFNTPKKTKEQIEIDELTTKLKSAIKDERYEDASDYNKRIKALKEKYNL